MGSVALASAVCPDHSYHQYRRRIWHVPGHEHRFWVIGGDCFDRDHLLLPSRTERGLASPAGHGSSAGRRAWEPDRPDFQRRACHDFISVGNFAVFNVADASITIGVGLLILALWLQEDREKKEKQETARLEQVLRTESTPPENHANDVNGV